MATTTQKSCSKCEQTVGIILCYDCETHFCFQHFGEHREQLDKQFEQLIQREKDFENKLTQSTSESNELFSQIDQWKKDSIDKIKKVAKETKEHLKQLLNQSNQTLLNLCKQIQQNILLFQQSQIKSEIQLTLLQKQLTNLEKQTNSFELIKSNCHNFLTIQSQRTDPISPSIPNEQFDETSQQIHFKSQGSIRIKEIDRFGHFVIVENIGLINGKDEDMVGWTIKRTIDSFRELVYRFPNDFLLKCQSNVKIVSLGASEILCSSEKLNCLIAECLPTWGTTMKTTINRLLDANGDERDVFCETYSNNLT